MDPILGVYSVNYEDKLVKLIDQTLLPLEFRIVECSNYDDIINAIKTMKVRGAPAIGVCGAFGILLFSNSYVGSDVNNFKLDLAATKAKIDASRPTAVNLTWATQQIMKKIQNLNDINSIKEAIYSTCMTIFNDDIEINRNMSRVGSTVIPQNSNILHHCNTGALATVDIGTALGVIYECHKQNKNIHVYVDETRPRLQGAKLTAWELMKAGVPLHLISDNAAGSLMRRGKIDVILYGADRVATNGDVANKIGTYQISVLGHENGIPVYPVVPTSTIDLSIATGDDIVIEERSSEEVTKIGGLQIAPDNVPVYNPAFDVTPHKYITGIITEEGICYPPFSMSLRAAKQRAEERLKSKLQ